MKPNRRTLLTHTLLTGLFAAISCVAPSAQAQYPSSPVRMVVGYAPGGPTDILARIAAKALAEQLGQPVVVENRGGGSGTIGVQTAVKSAADGQTLLLASEVDMAIVPHLLSGLQYDPRRDLKPVVGVAEQSNILVVRAGVGLNSLADLITRAKASPGSLTYGSAGSGSPSHMAGALLEKAAGIRLNHIPYKGAGPASADLLGGHIDAVFLGGPAAVGLLQSGQVKGLAVTGQKRVSLFPTIPTFAEAGIKEPGLDVGNWWAIVVPTATSQAVVDRLHKAWKAAIAQPELLARLDQLALNVRNDDPVSLAAQIEKDYIRWGQVIEAAGIKPN